MDAMLARDAEDWGDKLKITAKNVGKDRVEMIGATDRGAIINIWMPNSKHSYSTPSDNGVWEKVTEVHFWKYNNALEEYREIKDERSMVDLMRRNG